MYNLVTSSSDLHIQYAMTVSKEMYIREDSSWGECALRYSSNLRWAPNGKACAEIPSFPLMTAEGLEPPEVVGSFLPSIPGSLQFMVCRDKKPASLKRILKRS